MNFKDSITTLAQETFREILRIEKEYKDAEQDMGDAPARNRTDAVSVAKSKLAEANYIQAQSALNDMRRNLPDEAADKLAQIRRQYEAEMHKRFAADPARLDTAVLELLKSGILKPAEYAALMEDARKNDNATMARLIAKYAADAAAEVEKRFGANDNDARALRLIGHNGNIDPTTAALRRFDILADVFRRTVRNPSMIPHWDELAGPILEQL